LGQENLPKNAIPLIPERRILMSDSIIEQIKDLILREILKAGDHLPSEAKLADQLNVGRGTVREALRVLIHLGFLERNGHSTIVSEHVRKKVDIHERMAEIRKILEPDIVSLESTSCDPKDMDLIRRKGAAEMSVIRNLLNELESNKIEQGEFIRKGFKMGLSATTISFLISQIDPSRKLDKIDAETTKRKLRIIGIGISLEEVHMRRFKQMTGIEAEPTSATLFGMMTKFVSGGYKYYDIIEDNASYMPILWDSGLLKPIPVDAIPNAKYLFDLWTDPKALGSWRDWPLSQVYTDESRKYFKCVPIFCNFDGFGINTDRIPPTNTSYGTLVDPKYAGRVALWNDQIWTISWVAAFLNFHGKMSVEDISELEPEDVDFCIDFLKEKKKAGQFYCIWDNFDQIVSLMASGEVWIADCWNPVLYALKKSGINSCYTNALEGNRPWFHGVAMSKDCKNPDLVYEYANWALEGWFAASIAPMGWYGCTEKVKEYLSKEEYDFYYKGIGDARGSYKDRVTNIACWPHWPKNADYYLSSWLSFLAE